MSRLAAAALGSIPVLLALAHRQVNKIASSLSTIMGSYRFLVSSGQDVLKTFDALLERPENKGTMVAPALKMADDLSANVGQHEKKLVSTTRRCSIRCHSSR